MKIRRMLAVWAAKITQFVCVCIFRRQGVTWAGKIALKICPSILKDLSLQVRGDIFVVCGTNGKTTTNNMLCRALETEGKKVICNHTGSNMLNGVVAAFAVGAKMSGNLDADNACIEVDEASTRKVFPHIKPDYMILTNLFRDQLDRYGEIDTTMNLLKEGMQQHPDMKVVVNADDALCAYLAMDSGNPYITFGVGEKVIAEPEVEEFPYALEQPFEIREGRYCKRCGSLLKYNFYHYSQLGDYHCTGCDFKRPVLQYDASEIELGDELAFTVEGRKIVANYKGFYNIYNMLAAYAAARSAGFELNGYAQMLRIFNPENGRMERFAINGSCATLNLAKNPAGFNQNILAVIQDESIKDVLIIINDNAQDGTDISWLWDVDFGRLKNVGIDHLMVAGIRGQDMRLRLKYSDINCLLETDIEQVLRERLAHRGNSLYILVNYTALFKTRKILRKMERAR